MRSPDGEHEPREGDVVVFPRGKERAHQVSNRTTDAVRVLRLSSMSTPEIIECPDWGEVGARDAREGGS